MLNLDPRGLAAVALFVGVTVLITYLTRAAKTKGGLSNADYFIWWD